MPSRSSDPAGKVVVVTGASAGVGRATARAFAKRGAHVAALARATPGLDAVVEEIESEGVPGIGCPVDVADPDQVNAAAERAEAELGPIDVWVNDAMATVFARVWDIEPEEFARASRSLTSAPSTARWPGWPACARATAA